MLKQARVLIKGDVIGVGFRAWTKIQAKIIGVSGWVRNNFNQVEVVIQGDGDKISKMIEILKKGPLVSRVDDVEIFREELREIFTEFVIRK